jgi:predicted nucleotidyltransferase
MSVESLRAAIADTPGLRALVLFGSRATGRAHEGSDWDFAYLGEVDEELLRGALVSALAVDFDRVDVVSVAQASMVLKHEVARDGRVIYETPGAFDDFVIATLRDWFDMEPVLTPAYRALLDNL